MNRIALAAIAAASLAAGPAVAQSIGSAPPPGTSWVRLFEEVSGTNGQTETRALFDAALSTTPRQGEYLQYDKQLYRVLRINHFLIGSQYSTRRLPVEDHVTAIVMRCPSEDNFC